MREFNPREYTTALSVQFDYPGETKGVGKARTPKGDSARYCFKAYKTVVPLPSLFGSTPKKAQE